MKKFLLFVIIFICVSGASLFAWEPNDLTKFPDCMKADSWIVNAGIGWGANRYSYINWYVPPVRVSVDRNIPIGDMNLPFFAGGLLGFSWQGHKDYWDLTTILIGGRFGYHFNWGVKNLDTYAVISSGWRFYSFSGEYINNYTDGEFFGGAHAGVRYFINDFFGFYAEAGFNSFSLVDIGVTFKF